MVGSLDLGGSRFELSLGLDVGRDSSRQLSLDWAGLLFGKFHQGSSIGSLRNRTDLGKKATLPEGSANPSPADWHWLGPTRPLSSAENPHCSSPPRMAPAASETVEIVASTMSPSRPSVASPFKPV